jgi:DNA replication protein DnaC
VNCSFESYKTDQENVRHFELCQSWDFKESFILTGNTGTGKTHLAISMLRGFPPIELNEERRDLAHRRLLQELEYYGKTEEQKEKYQSFIDSEEWKYRKAICLFVPVVEMFVEINTAAMKDGGKEDVLDKYAKDKTYDCICFDDLGAEKMTDAKRENFYYIIDSRYRNMLPTIITSNFTINEINDTEPRIASRFAEMGKIIQFNGKDFRKS